MSDQDRVIGEHESHKNDDSKQAPEQSAAERKLVKKIEGWFAADKKHREKYDGKWMDYYKMFRGRQWKEERPVYRHSEVVNLIFSTIQSQVPILTDSRPKFDYLPQEPMDIPFSKILNQVAEHDWARFSWLNDETEVLYDGHIFGTGIGTLPWDPDGDMGLGAIKFESVDPLWCYPHHEARDINKDNQRFTVARPMDISKIKKKWPKMGKFVKPDIDNNDFDRTDLDKTRYKSPTDNVTIFESDSPTDDENKQAMVLEIYYDDDEQDEEKKVERVEVEGPEGIITQEKETFVRKKKYPHGRRTVIANGILLQDEPNPYEDFPYQKYSNYMLPREFWGESEVAQLEGPQKIFNKMISFSLDVLTLMGNPIWIVDDDSTVDTDALFNRPGLVVEKAPGTEVRREAGVQLQPYVLQMIDRFKQYIDDLSGATDVTKGATPVGVKAGIAITALQEAAHTRLRQKSRNLDVFLQDMGRQYKSRVMNFYSAPRIIRLTNDQSATKFFRFSIGEEKDEEGRPIKVARVQDFVQNEADGEIQAQPEKRIPIVGDFDVRVSTGTLLPFNKAQKESKLLNFYTAGLIDRQEVLKNTDEFSNWEEILQRMTEQEQAAAQAQGQA